jgi:anti-anti-sigma factor
MADKIFRVGNKYNDISGLLRDEFINDLIELRDNEEENIVLDFANVTSLSSIALAALGKLNTQLKDNSRKLQVINVNEKIFQIMDMTGLTDVISIEKEE